MSHAVLSLAQGHCHPRFERVREVFAHSLARGDEVGAAVCVWHQGERVIDLWGGKTGREPSASAWEADTLTTIFSCTKGVTAMAMLKLIERGLLDLDAPLGDYWPALVQPAQGRGAVAAWEAERERLTPRMLLNHRSGLLGLRAPLTLDELEDRLALSARLEAEPLAWAPNSAQGYHGVTYGLYAAELFRRVAGEPLGAFIARELTTPAGADLFLGLPPKEEARCAPIIPNGPREVLTGIVPSLMRGSREGRFFRGALLPGGVGKLAFGQPASLGARGLRNFNTPRVRRMELAWANGMASARGLANLYRALLAGELVDVSLLEPLKERQSWVERDRVLRKPLGFSQGFIKEETHLFSPNPESFGHPGAGGALGWADPKEGLAIGYVMNRMGYHVRSPRALALCHAVYQCLEA